MWESERRRERERGREGGDESEGYSEIFNARLGYVMYCCNVTLREGLAQLEMHLLCCVLL